MNSPDVWMTPGPAAAAVDRARALLVDQDAVRRLDRHDPTLWSEDPAVQRQIAQSLGWLDVMPAMEQAWPDLVRFRRDVRAAGLTHAVLLGMGGSSLISILWTRVFPRGPEGLDLLVLDSTDPESVRRVREPAPPDRTLYIVASKSGTTTEPDRFQRYFWEACRAAGVDPAPHFVAITDPGTPLERQATDEHWRHVFLNPADIGGRYSALSLFGLVPAALLDLPGEALLAAATAMRRRVAEPDSPALALAALIGGAVQDGRDKLTLAFPPSLHAFSVWLEQLLAESTGKAGTGVVPVPDPRLGAPDVYGDDRVLVRVALATDPDDPSFDPLATRHPAVRYTLTDVVDLGGQFLLWEAATALVGKVLGINPFDQPNVQESKDNTRAMLDAYQRDGALPEVPGVVSLIAGSPVVAPAWEAFTHGLKAPEYLAVMAYLPETPATSALLEELGCALRDRYRVAVTVGYGPRFLHSTGQLHKGGPARGRFLQVVADPERVPAESIPGVPETFNILIQAQAQGDLLSLQRRQRPLLQVSLGRDVTGGLERLRDQLARL
jgi:transaldolase/glucose-6-phosphate isomerase